MNTFTTLRAHVRTSPYRRDSANVTVCQRSMLHIRWLYKQLRQEGLNATDARMNLVFALAAGQRDMRTRIEATLREVRC